MKTSQLRSPTRSSVRPISASASRSATRRAGGPITLPVQGLGEASPRGTGHIVCHNPSLYKARADGQFSAPPCTRRWADLGKVEELSTLRKRAFHERSPARLFSRQAAGVEGRNPQRIEDHAADLAGRERQSS